MKETLISIFKNVKTPNSPYDKPIIYFLERIKNGSPATENVKLYRETKDAKYKMLLPGACISGMFSHRSVAGLTSYSQFACLDFDKLATLEQAQAMKVVLSKDKCCFSVFISPSGLGVKAIFRTAADETKFESYYSAICKKYADASLDSKTKDISRLCFESYDPDIYINENASEWTETQEAEAEDVGMTIENVKVPLRSESRIIDILEKWFDKKYSMSSGQRNTNVWTFAIMLNKFGVNEFSAINFLSKYSQKGFDAKEIEAATKSAYKKFSGEFGTRYFEDNETKNVITKYVNSGKRRDEIKKELQKSNNPIAQNEQVLDEIVSAIKGSDEDASIFWKYSDKGSISLVPHKYERYLRENNFFKFYPESSSDTFIFVRKDSNLIDLTNKDKIKDFVLNDLSTRSNCGFGPYDFMANNTKFFKNDFLNLLSSVDIEIKKDTVNKCYLYYKNCVVEVGPDYSKIIEYMDMSNYVWKSNVIEREYTQQDHHGGEFRSFIWYIAGENEHSYNCFKSAIGYLLHTYKTNADNKAIILNDEMISDNPNGRSGKGLFFNGIKQLKKLVSINGKNFDMQGQFAFQTVSTDTQVLVFDDVKRNFDFEGLFSIITEGLEIEYKNQGAIKLPVERSPKIVITTNYTIKGEGGSFDARKHELELSSHFNKDYTPKDKFGHLLFTDWDSEEWAKFDNFMIQCIQFYMQKGLLAQNHKNLEVRKMINEISAEFFTWCEDGNLTLNYRWGHAEFFNKFVDENQDFKKMANRTLKKWLKSYCEYKGIQYADGSANNQRYFILTPKGETQQSYDNDNTPPF